jgi:hypothetical protein
MQNTFRFHVECSLNHLIKVLRLRSDSCWFWCLDYPKQLANPRVDHDVAKISSPKQSFDLENDLKL